MSLVRYETNPFLNNLTIKKGTKTIRINSNLGKENNILIDQNTGEVKSTHIATYRQVDETKFVKLFTQNIALTFELTSAGIKAFNVLLHIVQTTIEKDIVLLDKFALEDFLKQNSLKLSISTFKRGVSELVKAKILAANKRKGFYFINPSFCFNGDRLTFTTIIERKNKEDLAKLEKDFELEKEGW